MCGFSYCVPGQRCRPVPLIKLGRTIDELDQLTQNNTRMVGSWTDRAGHLREEVQRLTGLVQRFRLPQAGSAISTLPASRAVAGNDRRLAPPEPEVA